MSGDTFRNLGRINEENMETWDTHRMSEFQFKNTATPIGVAGARTATKTLSIPDLGKDDLEPNQKFAGFGLQITSTVTGCLISHPCIVLRRQCQVNGKAVRYHLSPFTLLPIIIKLQNRQGLKTLWKGASGMFILKGCAVALETGIAEFTPFPREVSVNSSLKHLAQHLLLKSLAVGILTPFFCASLVETVQSDIASEKPGVLDCLKEGVRRLFRWGTPLSTRLFPIWQLILPTSLHGLLNYVISSVVQSCVLWYLSLPLPSEGEKYGAIPKRQRRIASKYLNDLAAMFFGSMAANILLYPAETVLHRLYLQGTRTIIDNLDSGVSVLPVITKYEGVLDCFNTIVQEEGAAGLYKGFGALILEYALQALILKSAKIIFQEVSDIFSSSKAQPTVR